MFSRHKVYIRRPIVSSLFSTWILKAFPETGGQETEEKREKGGFAPGCVPRGPCDGAGVVEGPSNPGSAGVSPALPGGGKGSDRTAMLLMSNGYNG